MALFGSNRDMSMLRKVNRELISSIITQQCALYKPLINETFTNVYGEASEERFYLGPILLDCLISRPDSSFDNGELGVDYERSVNFMFLKDNLKDANTNFNVETRFGTNLRIDVGDFIYYHGGYYEVDSVEGNQFFMGKSPSYTHEENPISSTLKNFGWDVSIKCLTHLVPPDKVGISDERLI